VLGQQKEIERCRAEQKRCRDHILNGGGDLYGAWLGLSDWFMEELILMAKRWNGTDHVTVPAVDAFIGEVIAVCRKHGFSISHEDTHGAFIVEPFSEDRAKWLQAAHLDRDYPAFDKKASHVR
jgi:hypothetical protein